MVKDEFVSDVTSIPYPESDYQTERNKPIPNKLHGILQSEIGFLLKSSYHETYDFPTEVSLATTPYTAPDICISERAEKFIRKDIKSKETDPPITTIEIISSSQSMDEMTDKVRELYFPMGVQSAWIVVPSLKAVHIMLPDDNNLYFDKGMLKDPATGIEISVDKISERVI